MEASRNQVKRPLAWAAAIALLLSAALAPAEPRVVLISIDGLRPDVALRADMPNLRAMMARGAFNFWATTTPVAITLPSHASMLTGVTVERHGIKDNDDDAAGKMKLKVPTIFDLAKAAGVSTAMVSGKSKFSLFNGPIDHIWTPDAVKSFKRVHYGSTRPTLKAGTIPDAETGDRAIEMLEDFRPRFLFIHFAINDVLGHGHGWGSRPQIENLATTDRQIGRLLETLKVLGLDGETTVLVTADHGGSGRQHGKDDDPSKFIPWVISGPEIARGLDLSLFRKRKIRTYDTFATICKILNLTPPDGIDGQVVDQAFENTSELMEATPATQESSPPAISKRATTTQAVEP